jgi:hypothetical protein
MIGWTNKKGKNVIKEMDRKSRKGQKGLKN